MTMKSNGFLIWMLLRHFKFVSISGVDTPGDTRAYPGITSLCPGIRKCGSHWHLHFTT